MEGRPLRLALVAALALAGCGGLSDDQYVDRAGTICHDATEPLTTRVKGEAFGDLARLAPEASSRYAAALKRFEALEPPDGRATGRSSRPAAT